MAKLSATSGSARSKSTTSTMNEGQTEYLRIVVHELQIIESNYKEFSGLNETEVLAKYHGNEAELHSIFEIQIDRAEQACKRILQISPPTAFISAHNELQTFANLYLDVLTILRSVLVHDGEELDDETVQEILQLSEKTSIEIHEHLDRYLELIKKHKIQKADVAASYGHSQL